MTTIQEQNEPIGNLIEFVALPELAHAHVLIISCGLLDFETIASPMLETWPYPVRQKLEKEYRKWFSDHPTRRPVVASSGYDKRVCFLVVHHVEK